MQISQTTPVPQTVAQARAGRATLLLLLLLGAAALWPRVLGLNDFLTTDEAYQWIRGSERFLEAVQTGAWIGTLQIGHPGVTRMWLGSLGLLLERAALANGWIGPPTRVEHLMWLRLPSAVLLALLPPLSYLLLRRLVAPLTALAAALLWATSPLLVAHDRLLHLDGLLTAFVSVSVICTLIACRAERPLRWMAAAGVCGGLALLTKSPALILLPATGLLLFWQLPAASLAERFRRSSGLYLLWLGVAGLVVVALWPALWVDAGQALQRYIAEIRDNGARPNGDGQFFLGRAIADPGPLYYPVAILFRLDIAASVGLLALPLALRRATPERRALLALGAFALFWIGVMTLGPKKFDRYALPAWPALMALAGAGLAALIDLRAPAISAALRRRRLPLTPAVAVLGLAGLVQVATLAWYHPYHLSFFNPLLGGGRVGQHVLIVGWGEGMEQVGAYLRSRPDIENGMALSALPPTLQPFLPVPVRYVETIDAAPANYAVVYRESIQRGAHPAIYARIRATEPLATITIHGIDYAWIHQLAKPFAEPVGARFGAGLAVPGVTVAHEPGRLVVTPTWDVRVQPADDYLVFLHLFDPQGRRVAQIDVAPGGADLPPTSAWQVGQQIAVPLPMDLPADLPPGRYRLAMGVYHPANGVRLPLTAGTLANPAFAGTDALLLTRVELSAPPRDGG